MERSSRSAARRAGAAAVPVILSVVVATSASAAPTPYSAKWTKRYDGASANDAAHALAVAPDGSAVYATGYSVGKIGGANYATVAYSAGDGALLWSRRYDGSAHTGDVSRAIAV